MSGICLEARPVRFHVIALVGLLMATALLGQPRTPIPTGKDLPLTKEEAQRRLHQFRHQRLVGDYVFQFELEHIPRRGESRVYTLSLIHISEPTRPY